VSETNGKSNGKPQAARKVIYLGMPCTGEMTLGAATGFHRCTRRKEHHVELLALGSSLATGNFNGLWCWALNAARKGPVDYFAMIHSDIEPPEYWLDELIDELEAKNLDVLGVLAPIKDSRGLTSIAVAHPTGSTWKIRNRITMREAYRLPETFASEDVGGPLLLNTGLWVCKFDMAWAPKIHFTVNDRIVQDTKSGNYYAQIEPEDWFSSRLYHELGLKVGCTRRVPMHHRGTMAFGNAVPWGDDHFDKEWCKQSFLDGTEPADWFPHKVAGWMTEAEGRELARLAEGKVVLEIGAYCGRSTICLAQKARAVGVIDTFDGRGTALTGSTLKMFRENIRRHNVADKIAIYEGESQELITCLPPVHDLVFVDGSHDRESVLADARAALEVLKPGGLLVFHDYGALDVGVTEAVDEFVADGGAIINRVDTLAVVRPPATSLVED